jgi:hypothetical protein
MKTAMQELRDDLIQIFNDNNIPIILQIDKYLEKEKEQIKDAWDKRGSTIVPRYFLEENITGEEYYDKKYKNEG